ncbi:hypothetical protein [Trujillonella humicola]|uniref:hypothetical protein n=1 Tax=Trujillonella humicola TaxID=3383699 RepID=UPI003905CB0A
MVLTVLVVVGITRAGERTPATATGRCTVAGSDLVLTGEQAASAATIAAVARARGLPERAVVIALATAQQESTLRNLDYGDRDSLGLFQQRPSQGWGSPEQVQDPVYAAGKFYDGLVEVRGWETGRLTEVAQEVQRSGFPEAYQKHEPMARALTTALLTGGLGCTWQPPEVGGRLSERTAAAAGQAERELGVPADEEFGAVSIDPAAGWLGASWAVAHAERLQVDSVSYAGRTWTVDAGWADSGAGDGAVRLELIT